MNHDYRPFIYFLKNAWDWDLSKIIGCLFLILVYVLWTRLESIARTTVYIAGVLILFLSLASPLDALSDEYLFSAHMLQHILLLMVVPPLLIIGLPHKATRGLLRLRWIARIEVHLTKPWVAWLIGNFVLWIWHIPSLYDKTVRSEGLHIFEHLTFLVGATVFWWPVLQPDEKRRLDLGPSMLYLITAALSNMSLGILLTFLSTPLYNPYFNPVDSWKILSLLRSDFYLTPLTDQKSGGVLMWVFGGFIFLGVILNDLGRRYRYELVRGHNGLELT